MAQRGPQRAQHDHQDEPRSPKWAQGSSRPASTRPQDGPRTGGVPSEPFKDPKKPKSFKHLNRSN
eukprot:1239517-Pyramimonas_sp.AAC.1